MPSVSSLSQQSFINVGPLTSTWTPPASCTEGPTDKYLARVAAPKFPLYGSPCSEERVGDFFNCIPDGEEIQSLWVAQSRSPAAYPTPWAYHSPASICPSGWTTVGAATKSANGDIDASGHFTQAETEFTATATGDHGPSQHTNPVPNILVEALAPGESAVLCCPSGFDATGFGNCFRNFPLSEFPTPTVCLHMVDDFPRLDVITATFTYNGKEVTGMALSQTDTVEFTPSRYIETVALSDVTADPATASVVIAFEGPFTGFEHVPMVTLVSNGDDEGETGEEVEVGDEEPTETGESAARSGRFTLGTGASALVATWGIAVLMGAGLMAAW
ncbi:hypothetical protein HYQ45_000568 [Verticillium longisporum]|uniref:Uncharacterized protein n=1 Tax=Verticillium longisporum TaxID=100787 RepID=A0A8I3A3T8_VERLO|nr:hypothetical protein HYQ45_000568 [Verticillium longisporum]